VPLVPGLDTVGYLAGLVALLGLPQAPLGVVQLGLAVVIDDRPVGEPPVRRHAVVVAEARAEEDGGRVRLLHVGAGVHHAEDRPGVRVEIGIELLHPPVGVGLDLNAKSTELAGAKRIGAPPKYGSARGVLDRRGVGVCHAAEPNCTRGRVAGGLLLGSERSVAADPIENTGTALAPHIEPLAPRRTHVRVLGRVPVANRTADLARVALRAVLCGVELVSGPGAVREIAEVAVGAVAVEVSDLLSVRARAKERGGDEDVHADEASAPVDVQDDEPVSVGSGSGREDAARDRAA
jgi:hypothetical protein